MLVGFKNMIKATDINAQYDASAKRLLGNKSILAHILVKAVSEFRGMKWEEAVKFIEGEPYINLVPVEPGLTNVEIKSNGERLVGLNTENCEINEGLVRFDIVFYVKMKDGLSQIIINVEAQKDEPKGYEILNRAIFYVSRLISSQKERDFENSHYDDIKQVYSIWVCMNMKENSLSHIHLTREDLVGRCDWKGKMDLFNIVMIGLSGKLTLAEKLNIIKNEYEINVENNLRKDVSDMCNLSQGLVEEGIAEGIAKERAEIIIKMYNKGFTVEEIAETIDKDVEEVKEIIEAKTLSLV